MLITRETDYALRMLRTLQDGALYSAGELSQRELVPQAFAYKILRKLARAEIVHITRGAEGGCRLIADLTQVTLLDLMNIMEEDGAVISCMDPAFHCPWRAAHSGCAVHLRLADVQRRLDEELRAHSLAELLS